MMRSEKFEAKKAKKNKKNKKIVIKSEKKRKK
jgi:hypothetical protein